MRKVVLFSGFFAVTMPVSSVHWVHFRSSLHPYSISQPSSFRHVVIQDGERHKVDYFFPSLGSPVTNVNIYSFPGDVPVEPGWYLRSVGGRRVHKSGRVKIMGKWMRCVQGQFAGVVSHWNVEQITFSSRGRIWRLTASYEDRFRSQRQLMLRMLATFQLRTTARR
jgi:hypothetical protein